MGSISTLIYTSALILCSPFVFLVLRGTNSHVPLLKELVRFTHASPISSRLKFVPLMKVCTVVNVLKDTN